MCIQLKYYNDYCLLVSDFVLSFFYSVDFHFFLFRCHLWIVRLAVYWHVMCFFCVIKAGVFSFNSISFRLLSAKIAWDVCFRILKRLINTIIYYFWGNAKCIKCFDAKTMCRTTIFYSFQYWHSRKKDKNDSIFSIFISIDEERVR